MSFVCNEPGCTSHVPHEHVQLTFGNGDTCPAIQYLPLEDYDPRAEVRDPETGDVIFPAVKGPLRLIQGGKK